MKRPVHSCVCVCQERAKPCRGCRAACKDDAQGYGVAQERPCPCCSDRATRHDRTAARGFSLVDIRIVTGRMHQTLTRDLQRACKVRLDDCLSKDPAAHSTRGPSHGQRREVHAHCDLSGQAPEEVQPASQSLLNVYSAG